VSILGAFPAAERPETGLSAPTKNHLFPNGVLPGNPKGCAKLRKQKPVRFFVPLLSLARKGTHTGACPGHNRISPGRADSRELNPFGANKLQKMFDIPKER
jgi:hypothetical protein